MKRRFFLSRLIILNLLLWVQPEHAFSFNLLNTKCSFEVFLRKILPPDSRMSDEWYGELDRFILNAPDSDDYFFKLNTRQGERRLHIERFTSDGNPVIRISPQEASFQEPEIDILDVDHTPEHYPHGTNLTVVTHAHPLPVTYQVGKPNSSFLVLDQSHYFNFSPKNRTPLYLEVIDHTEAPRESLEVVQMHRNRDPKHR